MSVSVSVHVSVYVYLHVHEYAYVYVYDYEYEYVYFKNTHREHHPTKIPYPVKLLEASVSISQNIMRTGRPYHMFPDSRDEHAVYPSLSVIGATSASPKRHTLNPES